LNLLSFVAGSFSRPQAFAALPDDQFKEAAAAAAASSGEDGGAQVEVAALRALSSARKIRLA